MRWFGVFVVALVSASCKETVPDRTEQMLVKFGAITDRMCACRDKACADTVQTEMNQWSAERLRMEPEERSSSPETSRRFQAHAERYGKCLAPLKAAKPN